MTKLEKEIRKDYIVVLLFVLASGCTIWMSLIRPAGSFIMLLLGGYVNAKRTKNNKGNSSINYLYWIIFLCVLNLLIEQSPYQDNSMLGYLVSLTGAYLIISRYDYYYFVKILTDIIYYITLIGIPLYLLSTWELIPTFNLSTTNSFTYKYVLWYTIGWPDLFYRYSGIWHEPGSCQIFLNTILWLNFDKIRRWTLTHKEKQQLIVIVIGLLLTQSTGGYLVFIIFIGAVILTSKLKVRNKRIAGFSLFLIGILAGYLVSIPFGLVDFTIFSNVKFIQLPDFAFTKWTAIDFSVLPVIITYIAFSISCMMEILSDHAALSGIIGVDLYRKPGIPRILLGEGVANIVSSSVGGLGATSYGEGIATIGFSKCASIYSSVGCALIMILLGFIGPVQAFIASIPSCVIGGGTAIILYSYIANSGIKQLQQVDFTNTKNLLVSGIVLSTGLSGLILGKGDFTLTGTALAVVLGIIFNLILKEKNN